MQNFSVYKSASNNIIQSFILNEYPRQLHSNEISLKKVKILELYNDTKIRFLKLFFFNY